MAAPLYTSTPNLGRAAIPTTNAIAKNDGSSTSGAAATQMTKVFTAGASGSYLDRVRFLPVASVAATSSVATTLRVFVSTVADPTTTNTTAANTFLLGELAVPIVACAAAASSTPSFDVVIDAVIPSGSYVHICQHVAQTANQNWIGLAIGGDF